MVVYGLGVSVTYIPGSEGLVLCRVEGGSVGELVVLRFLRLRWTLALTVDLRELTLLAS